MGESDIDRVLRAAATGGAVPGVVAAATDRRRVIYRGAFGFADVNARRELHPDAVFRIASMTKLLTSIAVLQRPHPNVRRTLRS
ncbi:MAG TPA: serine hydrolase domain-containing protein, partial [Vicinamibacterales bacterium]|nr:serine hydrolase domain-containing protein [Vicinamibacterales bacterium]